MYRLLFWLGVLILGAILADKYVGEGAGLVFCIANALGYIEGRTR